MFSDIKTTGWRPPFFVPAVDKATRALYPHMTTALPAPAGVPQIVNIPKGVSAVLVQANTQNARYVISPGADPTATAGFVLTAGNDPIAIPALEGMEISFISETAGSILEMQFGTLI